MDLKNKRKEMSEKINTPEKNLVMKALVFQAGLLKLAREAQLISEMESSGWRWDVCYEKISKLKDERLICFVIKKSGLDYDVCQKGIPLLKLEEKSPQEILLFLEELNWDQTACLAGVPGLKDERHLMLVMEKSGWDRDVCQIGVLRLTDENQIHSVRERAVLDYEIY